MEIVALAVALSFLLVPIFLYRKSSLLTNKMTEFTPFVFGGSWFLRAVLLTYLYPLFLFGWLSLPFYCLLVFVCGGVIGHFMVPSEKLQSHPIAIGFAAGFSIFVLPCLIGYLFKVRDFMQTIDPINYPPPPSAYAGVDNGAVASAVGGAIIIMIGGPILFAYMIWIFVSVTRGMVKTLSEIDN